MWIELLKPIDGHPAGKFLEIEDETVARSYIAAGLAKDGGSGPEVVIIERALAKFGETMQGFVTKTAEQIEAATTQLSKRPIVRSDGYEFNGRISPGESEADRSKSTGDFVRSVYLSLSESLAGNFEVGKHYHDRLVKVYGVERRGTLEDFKRGMTEGSGSSLGYTTPVTYMQEILREAAEEQVFVSRARKVPLPSRGVEWPALDQYQSPSSGQASMFGGVSVYRKGEAAQRTATSASTKKVTLNANDLTAFFALSRDLLQDSESTPTLDAMIPQLGGEAIGWRTDWECLNGTGNGQLLGIANAACTIQVTRNTSSHIKYQDVFTMYTRLLPRAKAGAAWFVHPFAMADIMQLQDPGNRFIYLPVIPGAQDGPIGVKPSGSLLGLPVIETEKCAQLGSTGDLNLFAMDRYLYGERSGLEVGLSEHFYYDTDQVAIKLKLRNDGKPQLVNSIYLADGSGSNKVSAFVTLN